MWRLPPAWGQFSRPKFGEYWQARIRDIMEESWKNPGISDLMYIYEFRFFLLTVILSIWNIGHSSEGTDLQQI